MYVFGSKQQCFILEGQVVRYFRTYIFYVVGENLGDV
jgi:hypothetical protein